MLFQIPEPKQTLVWGTSGPQTRQTQNKTCMCLVFISVLFCPIRCQFSNWYNARKQLQMVSPQGHITKWPHSHLFVNCLPFAWTGVYGDTQRCFPPHPWSVALPLLSLHAHRQANFFVCLFMFGRLNKLEKYGPSDHGQMLLVCCSAGGLRW